jgi:sec-independent protein translocase protein TatC
MSAEPEAPSPGESLLSHLLELRRRLLIAIVAVGVVFVALVPFANAIYTALAQPLLHSLPAGGGLIATEVTAPFMVPFKLAFFVALFATMPVLLYQLWAFVAPGLYRNERRLALPLLVVATLLFYAGCAFTHFAMLPAMFGFLAGTAPQGVTVMPDIARYLDFVMVMYVAGGFAFEVPVAVVIAVILGWVTPKQLGEWRGYVIVAIFIVAAILTPPDGLTQVMLALPMWALYELGLLWTRLLVRRKAAA